MCGIAGFVDFKRNSQENILESMLRTLQHRGPDDRGFKMFHESGCVIGLAQTRLSIIDTSHLGHQPMSFEQFSIVFNGEIYNYKEVQAELNLLGHQFRSASDTEVVLHAFVEWGINCVHKFIGMFAFVIYDGKQKKVYACRDRVGVKPFFYYWNDNIFLFASELKSFHQHPQFKKRLVDESIALYLQYGYIPGPQSIFENVFKMEPGTWLVLDLAKKTLDLKEYWNVETFYRRPKFSLSYSEAKEELEGILHSACNYRMVSDVPVGIFLSGGFDSSLVTALLQKDATNRLKTFTIGFPDGVDEAPFANNIAKHLGTEHVTYDCTETDAKTIIPQLAYFYDEPFADISAIPTILVSRLARKEVTVALSADGGDELFAGYSGYRDYVSRLEFIRGTPMPRLAGTMLNWTSTLMPDRYASLKRKTFGLGEVLNSRYQLQPKVLVEQSSDMPKHFIESLLINRINFRHPNFARDWNNFSDEKNAILAHSFLGALKDLLLVKVDRATMSVSLEGREPLLDHRLIEFAAQLPFVFKYDGTTLKKIVRDIAFKYVPPSLLDRPKTGFDLPLNKWLKHDLSYLLNDMLVDIDFFESMKIDRREVERLVVKFKNNGLDYPDIIWRIVSLRLWYQQWMK